jgi:hypothetical protein
MAFDQSLYRTDWGIQRFNSDKLYHFLQFQNYLCARWNVTSTLAYGAGTPMGVSFSGLVQNGRGNNPTSSTGSLCRRVKRRGVALTANSLLAPGSSIRAVILPHPIAFLACNGTSFTFTLTYRVSVKQDYELCSNCNLLAVFSPTRIFFPQPHFLQMAFLTAKFCSASSTQRNDCR